MRRICQFCHSRQWVAGQCAKVAKSIETIYAMTLAATKAILGARDGGIAGGLAWGESIFDEAIERKRASQWLFYGNSTRNASAMGGADCGVFANACFRLSAYLRELLDYIGFLSASRGK